MWARPCDDGKEQKRVNGTFARSFFLSSTCWHRMLIHPPHPFVRPSFRWSTHAIIRVFLADIEDNEFSPRVNLPYFCIAASPKPLIYIHIQPSNHLLLPPPCCPPSCVGTYQGAVASISSTCGAVCVS